MGVITWNGSASTDYGTDANWSSGSVPSASSNVVIPDTSSINNCILDTARTVNSFRIDSGGTFDGDGNLLTVDSEGDATTGASEGFAVNIDGIISGTDTDIAITTPATTDIDLAATSGSIRNLIINHASCVAQMKSDVSLSGNLTITAGQLTTGISGFGFSNLTVAGTTTIGPNSGAADQATLTCNASTVSLGASETSSYALRITQGGTFTGGTGTHTIGSLEMVNNAAAKCTLTSGVTTISSERTSADNHLVIGSSTTFAHGSGTITTTFAGTTHMDVDKTLNNLTINHASAVHKLSDSLDLAGNLTITAGDFKPNGRNLTVAGDVSVTGTLTGSSGAMSFGSLSVASGGTYNATSGTTTITKANGGTDGRAFFIHSSATFTHNNGLVKFTASSPQVAPTSTGQTSTSHPFYDLEQTTGTMQWKAEHHKVLNNCTMQGSAFNGSTGNVHVLGICRLTGETFNSGDTATNDNNFFQTLVIESGATVDLSAINITVGSLRNLGGTIQ